MLMHRVCEVQVLDAFIGHAGEVLRPANGQGSEPQEFQKAVEVLPLVEHLRRPRHPHAVGGRDVDERTGAHGARNV
jgi:hypothetical protein